MASLGYLRIGYISHGQDIVAGGVRMKRRENPYVHVDGEHNARCA